MQILLIIAHFALVLALGFYLITVLQWFSYKFERIIFHFTKPLWHLYFFILPILGYFGAIFLPENAKIWALVAIALIYIAALSFWHAKLDKKLVFTPRVKRFFLILAVLTLFLDFGFIKVLRFLPIFIPLILAFIFSFLYEKLQFLAYKAKAKEKLVSIPNLTIIQITASFGKTSIKNFLFQVLEGEFNCYKTPRSVNTLAGIIRDINENLPSDTQIYIAEAGARLRGDILEITEFLNPQIVVVGEIGEQHIEYFKSIENIRATKLEALRSNLLKKAFLHSSTECEKGEIYNANLQNISATLAGLEFDMKFDEIYHFKAPILGAFNAENLAATIHVARFLGLDIQKIVAKVAKIASVEHRLQIMPNDQKFIIDDSFNGNFAGMSSSYDLVREFAGRKVIITPGIIEANDEMNANLARKIDEIFDFVILTGSANLATFSANIDEKKLHILRDKSKLVETLAQLTQKGDLVLFSNDAPSFI